MINDFDLTRIAECPWIRDVRYFDQGTSTNDLALQHSADPNRRTPLLVLARRQTQGRGRGSNPWWASEGSLTFSILLDGSDVPLTANDWPRIPLITGLAVARALGPYVPSDEIRLKWPNDIYLSDRKLGGILVEASSGSATCVVIGIGLNVNNQFDAAPVEVSNRAISLVGFCGQPFELTDVLMATLQQLSKTFSQSPQDQGELIQEWKKLCLLTGRRVQVVSGSRRTSGVCRGVDDSGALCIETVSGIQRCHAGTVEFS